MVTFLLSGLWHGASWNYVLWGLYHGVLLVITRGRSSAAPRLRRARPRLFLTSCSRGRRCDRRPSKSFRFW